LFIFIIQKSLSVGLEPEHFHFMNNNLKIVQIVFYYCKRVANCLTPAHISLPIGVIYETGGVKLVP